MGLGYESGSRGRVLTTQEQRRALLQAFENSGLSGPQFARVAGINYQTFATWRQQHKRQACETKDSGNLDTEMVGFVEAVMQGPQDAASPRSVVLRFCPAKGMPLELELVKALQGFSLARELVGGDSE